MPLKFFLNLLWMFSTKHCFAKRKTIKMTGHHSRLRVVMGQSYPVYACTRANHPRYSSVHVTFCGSSKHGLLKWYLHGKKNLTGVEHIFKTIQNDVDLKRSVAFISFRLDYEYEIQNESTIFEFQTSDVSRALALDVGFRKWGLLMLWDEYDAVMWSP